MRPHVSNRSDWEKWRIETAQKTTSSHLLVTQRRRTKKYFWVPRLETEFCSKWNKKRSMELYGSETIIEDHLLALKSVRSARFSSLAKCEPIPFVMTITRQRSFMSNQ